jgi:hypothetical protein
LLILLLIGSTIPILGVASLYGGLDWTEVLLASIMLAAIIAFASAVGLYHSTIARSPPLALLRAYFALLLFWVGIPMLGRNAMDSGWLGISPRIAEPILRCIDPITTFNYLASDSPSNVNPNAPPSRPAFGGPRFANSGRPPILVPAATPPVGSPAWNFARWQRLSGLAGFVGIHLLAALLLLFRCPSLLRQALVPVAAPWPLRLARRIYGSTVSGATGFVEHRREVTGLKTLWNAEKYSQALNERRVQRMGDHNPLQLRSATANIYDPERYVGAFQIVVWAVVLSVVVFGSYFAPLWVTGFEPHKWMMRLSAGFLLLATLLVATSAFARERQYASWDLVLLADLKPDQHLAAAVYGIVGLLWPSMPLVVLTAWLTAFFTQEYHHLFGWLLTLAVLWIQLLATGLLISLCASKIGSAMGAAFVAVAAAAVVGPPALRSPYVWMILAAGWLLVLVGFRSRASSRLWWVVFLAPLSAAAVPAFILNGSIFLHLLPRPRTIEKVHQYERTVQMGRLALQYRLFLTDAASGGNVSTGQVNSGLESQLYETQFIGPLGRTIRLAGSLEHLYFVVSSLIASFVMVLAFRLGFTRVVWGPKPTRTRPPPI